MPKKPTTLETVKLVLELLRRIPKTGKISAKDLQRQLADQGYDRDLRSIQRLLSELAQGLGVEQDDREKPYGYHWPPKARGFIAPALNEQESLLLTLAEEYLRNLLPPRLLKSMETFFNQARHNLGPGSSPSLDKEWLAKVRIVSPTQPLLPAEVKREVFAEVSAALYHNRWLKVDYQNAQGHRADYQVMPLGMAQQGPGLYLVCRFDGHQNERTLALHRMQSARSTTITFKRPKTFNLKTYAEAGRFGFGEGQRIRLSFTIDKAAGAHLLETPLSKDQKVVPKPTTYQITATVVDSGQLDWWLNSFGESIRQIRRTPID